MLSRKYRTRLGVESLEFRDNPSAPGGDAPYTPPAPPSTDPAQTTPTPPASPTPTDVNPLTGGSTLPYTGP